MSPWRMARCCGEFQVQPIALVEDGRATAGLKKRADTAEDVALTLRCACAPPYYPAVTPPSETVFIDS